MNILSWQQNPDPVGRDWILENFVEVSDLGVRQSILEQILSLNDRKYPVFKIYLSEKDPSTTIIYSLNEYLIRTISDIKDSSGRFMPIYIYISINKNDTEEIISEELSKLKLYKLTQIHISAVSEHLKKKDKNRILFRAIIIGIAIIILISGGIVLWK